MEMTVDVVTREAQSKKEMNEKSANTPKNKNSSKQASRERKKKDTIKTTNAVIVIWHTAFSACSKASFCKRVQTLSHTLALSHTVRASSKQLIRKKRALLTLARIQMQTLSPQHTHRDTDTHIEKRQWSGCHSE